MARIWSEEGKLAGWLEVELAALDGWVEVGAVPAEDVSAIRAHAVPPSAERVAEIERTTDHDLAAFVDAVGEQLGPEGRWVHYGLTSSDVVDTALALQIRDAGGLVLQGVERALAAVLRQAEAHRRTICIGRSHGIHAEPTMFGRHGQALDTEAAALFPSVVVKNAVAVVVDYIVIELLAGKAANSVQ